MKFYISGLWLLCVILTGCKGETETAALNEEVSDDSLLPAAVAMQSTRVKALDGFNTAKDDLVSNSFNLLTKSESMLKGMKDNRDLLIDILKTLEQPFLITTAEPITVDANVSATTPPFAIGGAGLTSDFLLLSSTSRFLITENTIKTRFKLPAELTAAWLRAVQFSDQVCVYVALQTVATNGTVTSASNTLVVPLVAADKCSVQLPL